MSTGKVFLYIFSFIPLILHCPPHYVSAPSTGKIFSFSFFFFCTLVIRNATSPPPDQPFTMPTVFPNTNWACEACTHPNKGGNMCVMCQTPRPPTKTPPRAGAVPPPAIETAAASTDLLLAVFPGTPRARGGAPPVGAVEENVATSTDQLPVAFPGTLAL